MGPRPGFDCPGRGPLYDGGHPSTSPRDRYGLSVGFLSGCSGSGTSRVISTRALPEGCARTGRMRESRLRGGIFLAAREDAGHHLPGPRLRDLWDRRPGCPPAVSARLPLFVQRAGMSPGLGGGLMSTGWAERRPFVSPWRRRASQASASIGSGTPSSTVSITDGLVLHPLREAASLRRNRAALPSRARTLGLSARSARGAGPAA